MVACRIEKENTVKLERLAQPLIVLLKGARVTSQVILESDHLKGEIG